MDKNEKILLGAACFFAGAVAGFLIAPIKKGIYCGNNNGNNYMNKDEEENDELNEIDKKAKARINNDYTWEKIIDKYESLFLEV